MPIEPMGGIYHRLFGWLLNWVKNHANTVPILDEYPSSQKYWIIPGYSDLTEAFLRTEDAIITCCSFGQAEENYGDYSTFFKHAASVHMNNKYSTMMLIDDICQNSDARKITLVTSDEYLPILFRSYFGYEIPLIIKFLQIPRSIIAFVIYIFISIYNIGFVFSRLKWNRLEPKKILLGLDFSEDNRSIMILNEMVDCPSDCLIVYRSDRQLKSSTIDVSPYPACMVSDGYVPLTELFQYLKLATVETFRIYQQAKKFQINLFYELIKGPFKRISFRALFHRYSFQYFLSRDDYNSEHIIRTSELRRAGIISLGINHGLPNPSLSCASWRHIDYDVYLSMGEQLSKTYFADMWPKDMKITPIGSLGMSRRHLQERKNPRPKDIIYFTGPGLGEGLMDEAAIKIAEAFPEKKVYVRNKRRNTRSAIFDDAPGNLIHTDENSYDLMLKASYCVGGYSTVIAEAIQFGLATFSFDFLSPEDEYYYRHFPGLCVKTAQEAVDRISRIETGKDVYPTDSFAGLIDLSGQPIGDIIRQEMGLPPKQ